VLLNAGTVKRFKLWHRDDPARPTLDTNGSVVGTVAEPFDSATGGGERGRTGSRFPYVSREPEPEPVPTTPDRPGAGDPEDDA
jgi:hypothetical protein